MLLSLVVGASVETITAQCPLTVEPPSSRLPHSAEALLHGAVITAGVIVGSSKHYWTAAVAATAARLVA